MNKNRVELLGYYGGDKRACLSAWQSTTEELGIKLPSLIGDRVDIIFDYIVKTKKKTASELLDFLANNHHETPFEKSILDFQIKGDLASHIHSLKHRISSINSESARYKEFINDNFYLPEDWKNIEISKENKDFLGLEIEKSYYWYDFLKTTNENLFSYYHCSIKDIEKVLGRKRAKETCRYFLSYSTQLNYDWQMNFRSFVNIQRLRNDAHAQKEIHQIANTMLYLVQNIPDNPFEYSINAFNLKVDEKYLILD